MAGRTLGLSASVAAYLRAVGVREPAALARLRAATAKLPMGRMQIAPEQGQFMALLVEAIGARWCLEIGTFTGYSAAWVALALPPDGRVVACDVSAEWTAVARRYWKQAGVEAKIDLRLAPALVTLDRLLAEGAAGRFDFAFIDADKENYGAYYERALGLVRPGGLVAIDNVLWSGAVADPRRKDALTRALRDLNRKLKADRRVTVAMIPVGDGLTLARKRP